MSVSVSIDLVVASRIGEVDPVDVVRSLVENGWSFAQDGVACFLRSGDIDDFDWEFSTVDKSQLFYILAEKVRSDHFLGLVLLWHDSGGSFLVRKTGEITFLVNVNRINLGNLGILDVGWYLDKLLMPLGRAGFEVSFVSFSQNM